MDAKLIGKMWDAQKADPEYQNVLDFIGDIYKFFVPSRKWLKVCKAHSKMEAMKHTKKDIIIYIRFYLEAKNVYLGLQDALGEWKAAKEGKGK